MAEVAGLFIGGIALASQFETGMNAFEHIETAKNYGGEYEKLALKTSVLRLRLSRWAMGIELATKVKKVGSVQDGEVARALLGHIVTMIESTELMAQRYKVDEKDRQTTASDSKVDTVDALIAKVKAMAVHRQKNTSTKNIEIRSQIQSQIQKLATSEAQELIQPSSVRATDNYDEDTRIALLAEATIGTDAVLQEELKKAAPVDKRNVFSGKFLQSGAAKVLIGDYVAPGNAASGGAVYSGNFTATGKATAQYGTVYGPKGVFNT